MATNFGRQTASGHLHVSAESKEPYAADVEAQLRQDATQVIARYPQKRSALLPLLHLVQSVDGYVSGRGIDLCAQLLDLELAEVSGVATFYSQFKRHPNGEYTVGVCTNTLCAIMGGDRIWDEVSEHLGIGHDETTSDGKVTLERIECNAACDYAPVVMTNWEFFDNQTPASTKQLVDDLRAGTPVTPTRGADHVCTFKEVSRTLAGFPDGLADEGVGAGPASLVGLDLARKHGWTAPGEEDRADPVADPEQEQAQQPADAPSVDEGSPDEGSAEHPAGDKEPADKGSADKGPDESTDKGSTDKEPVQHPAGDESAPRTSDADRGGKSTETGGDESPEFPDILPRHTVDESAVAQAAVAAVLPPFVQEAPRSASGRAVPVPETPPVMEPPQPGAGAGADEPEGGNDGAARPAGEAGQEPLGPGSAAPGPDGKGPHGWEVKGNARSRVFHTPESPWYRRTKAEVWFRDAESALAAGFTDALEQSRGGSDDENGKGES